MLLELSLPAVQTQSCSYLHPGCSSMRQGPSAVNSCQEITQNKTQKIKVRKAGEFSYHLQFLHRYGHNQCLGSACDG